MWLTQGLRPSCKTIANFRKNNPKALETIFKEFSILLKNLKLITGDLVAVDGAFFSKRVQAQEELMLVRILLS
jgi:transposase